mmetsp:Transcript_20088/g.17786  ORF Transcript_20088/g.17786 Transcript_20088/m.17786 type:complete len:203 (+) Transcript_20088:663-1271(+)
MKCLNEHNDTAFAKVKTELYDLDTFIYKNSNKLSKAETINMYSGSGYDQKEIIDSETKDIEVMFKELQEMMRISKKKKIMARSRNSDNKIVCITNNTVKVRNLKKLKTISNQNAGIFDPEKIRTQDKSKIQKTMTSMKISLPQLPNINHRQLLKDEERSEVNKNQSLLTTIRAEANQSSLKELQERIKKKYKFSKIHRISES